MPVAEYVPPPPRGDAGGGLAGGGLAGGGLAGGGLAGGELAGGELAGGELAGGELASLPLPQAGSERLANLTGWLASQGIGRGVVQGISQGVGQGAGEERHDSAGRREVVPTGFAALDRLLPAGGVRRGGLIEWIDLIERGGEAVAPPAGRSGSADGSRCLPAGGATALACAIACRIAERSDGGAIIVVDRRGWFHPPAVLPWLGDRESSLYVARPAREADEVWAIDQALRCPGVAAVIGWPERVHSTALRRWQLAARTTGAVGLLVRPSYTRRDPTWAEARVAVKPVALPLPVAESATGRVAVARQTDLAIRRLRLALVGGPWCGDETVAEQQADLLLDMRWGKEGWGKEGWGKEGWGKEGWGKEGWSWGREGWSQDAGRQAWRMVGAAPESRQPDAAERQRAHERSRAGEDPPEHGKERVSCRAS